MTRTVRISQRLVVACAVVFMAIGFAVLVGPVNAQSTPPTSSPATRPATQATTDALPTVEEVLERSLEASGGAEAHLAAATQRQTGMARIPGTAIEVPITIMVAAPDKVRIELKIPRAGSFIQGTDGDVGWSFDPFNGARIMSAGEATFLKRGLDPKEQFEPAKRYKSMRVVGEEQVETPDGTIAAYRIDFVTNDDVAQSEWYAVESGLRAKRSATYQTDFGDEMQSIAYGDWRKVSEAGLMVPFASKQIVLNSPIELQIEQVEVNPDLPADAFDPPIEVKEKLQKRAE